MHLKKGSFFIETGDVSTHLAFLEKELIRYFVYKDEKNRPLNSQKKMSLLEITKVSVKKHKQFKTYKRLKIVTY